MDELPDIGWGPCINPGEILYDRNGGFLASLEIYQTSNGTEYEFLFEKQDNGSIRIEIVKQPDYGSRDESPLWTHRTYGGKRYYVDWATPINSLSDAKQVAAEWAKRTERYIKTGKPFES